jgi:acyl-CoA dehydrogenase
MRDEMIRTLDRVVADSLGTGDREKADGGGMAEGLWAALSAQGLTAIGETSSEIAFTDAMTLVARAAYHAAPVPFGETVMARRLLSLAGIAPPDGAICVAAHAMPGRDKVFAAVPYARACRHVVAASGNTMELHAIDGVAGMATNHAGEPRDVVDLSRRPPIATGAMADTGRVMLLEGALIRSVEISGALERTLEHSLGWVNERVQFGRTISKFQAIQHSLAVMASEVAATRAAVAMAVEAAGRDGKAEWFVTAVAKSRAGEAAGKVANGAHAAFGAMGFTREHPLHYSTRRLWAWRDEYGSETAWQAEIGRHVAANGGRRLWQTVTQHG